MSGFADPVTYDEHNITREVERACVSPLVFAAIGGMEPTATTVFRKLFKLLFVYLFFRKLASMLAEKHSINYSKCLFWL